MTYVSTDHDLQRFFRMSRDLLCIAGFDGYFKLLSPAWRDTLGYTFQELTAKPFIEFVHADDRAQTLAEAAKLSTGEETVVFENRYYTKDGSLLRLSWSAASDLDKGLIYAVATDITRRSEAESALRDSSTRLRAILDTVINPIITIDERGVIESFNAAAEQVFEYPAAEVIGRNINMLMPEPYRSEHDGYLARYLSTGERRVIGIGREVTGRRKSGAVFPMELTVSEMQFAVQRMFVGVVRDISERKSLEKMKSDFVSTVSHELRTPMNAILGFTQLLSYATNLTDAQKLNLTKVHKAGEHLLSLVNDVLDMSRVDIGSVELTFESVAIKKLMRECRNLTVALAESRDIELRMDCTSESELYVRADHNRLRQVLINFITNAVKYSNVGCSVWVVCKITTAGHVRISVRDNGPGLTPEQQQQLFQPFNRLGAQGGAIEGTGVGLSIAKQLVKLMDGDIGVVSEFGVGSTFWVEFAQAQGVATDAQPAVQSALPPASTLAANLHKSLRVLYIEDNPVNFELVHALCLQFWPQMEVLGAATAEAGLEQAVTVHPDLILMDINLPGMDGYQALAQLQADAKLRAIPVVAVTANAMPENIKRGHDAGFSDYLTKPLDIPKFVAAVECQLGQELDTRVPSAEPAPTGDYSAVLDAHATGQLRDLLGANAAPIVDSLLNDLPKRLALLAAAVAAGDTRAVRNEAHTMKGSSGNLGATAFAALCTQLSEICKAGELLRLPAAAMALEQEFKLRVAPALLQFKQELLRSVGAS